MNKVKEDTDDGGALVSDSIKFYARQVNQTNDGLSGSVDIPFNRAG
jgi:hypothetical protein